MLALLIGVMGSLSGPLDAHSAPVEATILTVTDELLPPALPAEPATQKARITFQTPAELSNFENGESIAFESGYPTLSFNQIKAFLFERESRRWFRSEALGMEWYRLGPVDSPAPPLPGWNRTYGEHASWQTSVPATLSPTSPFVNRSQAVWVTDDPSLPHSKGEFLLRTRLIVDESAIVSAALLHLAVSGDLLAVFLNEFPIVTSPESSPQPQIHDVSRLLKPGSNILAFRIRNSGAPSLPNPSLAFSLEYTVREGLKRQPSAAFQQTVLTTRQGDRVRGRLLTFNPVSVLLQTPYGRYGADWDRVESLIFPQGWYEPAAEQAPVLRRMTRFFGFAELEAESKLPDAIPQGIPISAPRSMESGGILLRDGRLLSDELMNLRGEEVTLRGWESQEIQTVNRSQIAAIYPPPPERTRLERPSRDFATLDCRVKTRSGDVFSGILRQIQSQRIVLEHTGDGMLTFPPSEVLWIWFPMHTGGDRSLDSVPSSSEAPIESKRARPLAILAIDSPGAQATAKSRELHVELQEAAFLAGLECEFPLPGEIIDPTRLRVRNYPIVAIADENGGYPDSVESEGDARAAVREYVEGGGTLLVYARRGALKLPGRWVGTKEEAEATVNVGLLEELNLSFAQPEIVSEGPQRAFDHPPNNAFGFSFERSATMPDGLLSLPPRIDAPDQISAPYYPIVLGKDDGVVLYRFVSDSGIDFGPALTIVSRGKGRVVVIDHSLWNARIEGRAFTKVVLPRLLNWIITPQRQG